MRLPAWRRRIARAVLVTFTTGCVGCGGSSAPPTTTTTTTTSLVTTSSTAAPSSTLAPATTSTLPEQAPEKLGKQELRDLVAPVALYPDVVLASLLPATTNADQVHEAAQWVGSAQHVDDVPKDRAWDGSVVGLLQFPDVVRWLDANPAWTDQMGQAVTYQQADVLTAIQDYRRTVRDAGNLKSNKYQNVRSTPDDPNIHIDPARPDVVYVPSYDPEAATQPQPEQPSTGINPWLAFGGGAVVGALGAWALYSIFDDNDHDHGHNNYSGGGRQIRRYDNYYYANGRRPPPVDWQPRPRAHQPHPGGVQRPRRLEHVATTGQPARGRPLLPPVGGPAGQAAPGAGPRAQRQEQRRQQQAQQAQRQEQVRQQRQQRRAAQQQRQQQQQQERQERQEQQRQEQQQRRQQREQRQQPPPPSPQQSQPDHGRGAQGKGSGGQGKSQGQGQGKKKKQKNKHQGD